MIRRVHVEHLREGANPLSADQAHHVRDVLRLEVGEEIELFDSVGRVGRGRIALSDARGVVVSVDSIIRAHRAVELTVAAAIPKGERADWMIEKLSELGVARFVPLRTARGVVTAEGTNKRDRWSRLATESAKQSRRAGVMEIAEPIAVREMLASIRPEDTAWCLSTADATPLLRLIDPAGPPGSILLFIGPEGGWADDELALFRSAGVRFAGLTKTVLRVETAAIASAAIVCSAIADAESSPAGG